MLITQKQSLTPIFCNWKIISMQLLNFLQLNKKILGSGLRATLIFQNFKVALNPLLIFLLKFAESLIVAC